MALETPNSKKIVHAIYKDSDCLLGNSLLPFFIYIDAALSMERLGSIR